MFNFSEALGFSSRRHLPWEVLQMGLGGFRGGHGPWGGGSDCSGSVSPGQADEANTAGGTFTSLAEVEYYHLKLLIFDQCLTVYTVHSYQFSHWILTATLWAHPFHKTGNCTSLSDLLQVRPLGMEQGLLPRFSHVCSDVLYIVLHLTPEEVILLLSLLSWWCVAGNLGAGLLTELISEGHASFGGAALL